MNEATKDTTNFIHYKDWVAGAAGLSVEEADRFISRIGAAYDMGEPVWMIAGEIQLRASAPKRHKTPLQIAARVVRINQTMGA